MKAPSPLLGFNNNFKHKGQVYHVQTEDSGVKYQHIITHLFADGGRILKSIKTSYASLVDDPNLADVVRGMMKDQHKAMIIALRDGAFDPGGNREVKLPTTGAFATATSAGGRARGPVSEQRVDAVAAPAVAAAVSAVDARALERAVALADDGPPSPPVLPASDLPPPPANVLGGAGARTGGGYRAVTGRNSAPPPPLGPAAPAAPAPPLTGAGTRSKPPSGRYAPSRPASMFATSKPTKQSLFGDELLSERSLDEVILAYLAEDLEGEAKK